MNNFILNDRTPKPSKYRKAQTVSEMDIQALIKSGTVRYVNYDTGFNVPTTSRNLSRGLSTTKEYLKWLLNVLSDNKPHKLIDISLGRSNKTVQQAIKRLRKQGVKIRSIKENNRVIAYQMLKNKD